MNERRIATVQRVRALQERIARSEVARRQHVVTGHERAEAAAWQDVERRAASPSGDTDVFRAHRAMLEGGAFEAERARLAAEAAGEDLARAVEVWQQQAQRRDGIDRLAERLQAEHRADVDRRSANELDDLVVMRHREDRS